MHTPSRAPRLLLAVAVMVLLAACDHYAAARAAAQPSLTPAPSPAPAPVVTDECAAPDVGAPVTVDLVRRAERLGKPVRVSESSKLSVDLTVIPAD